jgi:hypothetical protein
MRGGGVLADIVERLLDNPQQMRLGGGWQRLGSQVRRNDQLGRDAGELRELLDTLRQHGAEIEDGRGALPTGA